MEGSRKAVAEEWQAHWGLVFAAFLGTSFVAVPSLSLGLFIGPLQDEFGWSRTEISLGLTVFAIVGTPLAPFAGALADRFGSRPVALPGLFLSSLAFAAFSLVTGAFWMWMALWVVYTLVQLLIRSMIWNRAISAAFSASRGLALAALMSGSAMGQLATPIITQWLIGDYGWRIAFAGLGLGWGGLALIAALLFFHEPRSRARSGLSAVEAASTSAAGGLTLTEALRDFRMLRIGFAILLQSSLMMGVIVHLFPLLTGAGVSRADAANQLALIGIAALVGQLSAGWLADRVSGSVLPVCCFAVPGLAYLMLLAGLGSGQLLLIGVLLAGLGSGSAMAITTYLSTRYAGVRHFGKIFGLISSCMGLGAGVGPLIAGGIFDMTGSYDLFLILAAGGAVLASLLVFRLGPYPRFDEAATRTSNAIA